MEVIELYCKMRDKYFGAEKPVRDLREDTRPPMDVSILCGGCTHANNSCPMYTNEILVRGEPIKSLTSRFTTLICEDEVMARSKCGLHAKLDLAGGYLGVLERVKELIKEVGEGHDIMTGE